MSCYMENPRTRDGLEIRHRRILARQGPCVRQQPCQRVALLLRARKRTPRGVSDVDVAGRARGLAWLIEIRVGDDDGTASGGPPVLAKQVSGGIHVRDRMAFNQKPTGVVD